MKRRTLINIIAAAVIIAGLAASVLAPWWVVLFICLPVIWAAAAIILKVNTDWIWNS